MTTTLLPIRIVRSVSEVNLNTVSHNQRNLMRIVRSHERETQRKMRHCEAICYSNKTYDKFRLVVMFFSIPVLILPPIDPEDKLSLYLVISRFLRKFSANSEVTAYLDQEIEEAEDRINVSKARKANAKKAVRKKRAA